jgi:hypothetical protein
MRGRRISIACVLLLAVAGCDFPADDPNVQIELPPAGTPGGPPLKLEPANAGAPAACGPGAEIREPYPCPCLQTPGMPTPMNCIRSMRTCYRSRTAPLCPEPAASAPGEAGAPAKGGA